MAEPVSHVRRFVIFNLKNVVLTHMDEFAIGKKQPNIVFILIIFGFKIDPSYL